MAKIPRPRPRRYWPRPLPRLARAYPVRRPRRPRSFFVGTVDVRVIGMYPIARTPVVAGMLLGDSTAEITAGLYRYPDLDDADLIASLPIAQARAWSEVLSEPGSGSISLMFDDPAAASFVEDGDDVVVFSYRGLRAFAMLVEGKEEDTISDNEEQDQVITYNGRGHLGILSRALVYPTSGTDRDPIEEDRLFNWSSPDFDDSSWIGVIKLGTVLDAMQFAVDQGFAASVGDIRHGFPTTDINIYWVPGYGTGFPIDHPEGTCYFRETINIASDGTYVLYGEWDDEGELYVDGQLVSSITGLHFLGSTSINIELTAGTHTIAASVTNLPFPGSNAGNFGWAIYTQDAFGDADVMVIQGSTNMVCVAYPPGPPGMAVGKVMRLVLDENQADGVITDLTWTFTDTTDSGGVPWPVTPDIGTKTGTDVLTFFRELSATYIDMAMDPSGLILHAWNIDGRGTDLSGSITITPPTDPNDPATGNIRSYSKTGEFFPVGEFLLRHRGGWSRREDASSLGLYGRRRALLEIGAPASIEEIFRMADGQFVFFADPRTEINATIMPMSNADAPYWSYRVGDSLLTPDGVFRLLGLGMAEDDTTGLAIPTLTFGSIILGAQERVFQALSKLR